MGIFGGIGDFVLIGPLKVIGPSVVMEFCILLLSSSFPPSYIFIHIRLAALLCLALRTAQSRQAS